MRIDRRAGFPAVFPAVGGYRVTVPGKVEKRGYKGSLYLEWDGRELVIINEVPLEEYVASVVLSEMGWQKTAAMRAQGVLARTWAVTHRRPKHLYDFGDLTNSQVYKGLFPQTGKTLERLGETFGQLLLYKGKPVEVYYYGACSYRVFSAYEIWGKAVPYLKKATLPGELKRGERKNQGWTCELVREKVDPIFTPEAKGVFPIDYRRGVKNGRLGVYVNEHWVGVDEFRLRIDRQLGWCTVRSNDFFIEETGETLLLRGRGFGHLVGLGQEEAVALAGAGYDYKKILQVFYKGCEMEEKRK